MFLGIWQIALFEIQALFRSRRALVGLLIYLLLALITVFISAWVDGQIRLVGGLEGPLQEGVVETFSHFGHDSKSVLELMQIPLFLSAFFWVGLSFLPLLIVMLSSDIISRHVRHRSLRFILLRSSREAFLLGQLLAHSLVIVAVSLIGYLGLLGYAAFKMPESLNWGMTIGLSVRFCLLTMGYAFCYLCLTALISSLLESATLVMLVQVCLLLFFFIISFMDSISWMSPNHYKTGLWSSEPSVLSSSIGAFAVFTLIFFAVLWAKMRWRDI